MRQPALLGELGGAQRARQHGFDQHVARVERLRAARVLVHQLGEELLARLPQLTPMRTGRSFARATSMMVRKCSSRRFAPTLPGVMRYLASARAHAGYLVSSKWPL